VLRLNISPALAAVMGRVIGDYVGHYPAASVDMAATDRMVDLVEEGFDLAVRITPVTESNLIVRRLTSYRHALCGSPAYLARRGTPQAPADLAAHNCLNYAYYPFGQEWHFIAAGREQTVRISGNLRCNTAATLVEMALTGQGLIMVPGFLVAEQLRAGVLVSLLREYLPVEFEINAFYPHRRHLSAKVRAFIDLLIKHFAADAPP